MFWNTGAAEKCGSSGVAGFGVDFHFYEVLRY
jgi:hypothetical protein